MPRPMNPTVESVAETPAVCIRKLGPDNCDLVPCLIKRSRRFNMLPILVSLSICSLTKNHNSPTLDGSRRESLAAFCEAHRDVSTHARTIFLAASSAQAPLNRCKEIIVGDGEVCVG